MKTYHLPLGRAKTSLIQSKATFNALNPSVAAEKVNDSEELTEEYSVMAK